MFEVGSLTGYPEGDITNLFLEGMAEVLQYSVYFAIVLLIAFLTRKMKSGVRFAVSCITVIAGILYLAAGSVKTECMMSVMFALMLTLAIYIFEIITYDYSMLLLLFTSFLFPQRLFNSSFGIFGYGVIYLVIWLVILSFSKLQNRQGESIYMAKYVLFTFLSFVAFLFKNVEDLNYTAYRSLHIIGRVEFVLFEIGLVLIFAAGILLIKKKAGTKMQVLMRIDRKYPDMKKWIVALEIGMIAVIILFPLPFVLTRTVSDTLQKALAVLDILLLAMQMIYLVLIYRIMDYQHTVQFADREKEYYSSLNQNLENMQDLRHDMKNIFLAMSVYVERSTDEEMKDFYKGKICPLIEGEIEQNAIFSKLCQIPSEELRAFLYMKCMQAFQRGIPVRLAVHIEQDKFYYGMELVDLTRILGILFDNAIEECENEQNAFIETGIRTQDNRVSYSIKNSIRQGHDFGHMPRQKSDKTGHKGRGLKIVRNILQGYPDVTLNTLIDKGVFRQTLNLTL